MRYYIIAGEASGDLHGSNLMRGLYADDPSAEIRFWGGGLMLNVYEGMSSEDPRTGGLVQDYKEGAVMGYTEILGKAGQLLGNLRFCKRDISEYQPDVVILIDYPGFNFRIAKYAHKAGIKVFYYIAPKVWASREGRIRKLKKYVDMLYIVFPFEIPYFESKGVDFIYNGNPLVDAVDNSVAMNESRNDFLKRNKLPDKPIIAMLAGSRKKEISLMMPVLVEFASKLHSIAEYSDYQFIIAGAPARSLNDYFPHLLDGKHGYIKILFWETQSIVRQAEAAIINSGTASLEAVLLNTPQVVGYPLDKFSYWLGTIIIKIKFISLGNLCLNRLAFKELIAANCTADNLVSEIRALIENKTYREKMLADYALIRSMLGGSGASNAVAKSMIETIPKRGTPR